MPKRIGDYVALSPEEMAEVERLKVEIPAAYARAGSLFRDATMAEFAEADRQTGLLLKRWRELIG
jgi:hypothetical protein